MISASRGLLQVIELIIEMADFQFAILIALAAITRRCRRNAAQNKQNRHYKGGDFGQKHAVFH